MVELGTAAERFVGLRPPSEEVELQGDCRPFRSELNVLAERRTAPEDFAQAEGAVDPDTAPETVDAQARVEEPRPASRHTGRMRPVLKRAPPGHRWGTSRHPPPRGRTGRTSDPKARPGSGWSTHDTGGTTVRGAGSMKSSITFSRAGRPEPQPSTQAPADDRGLGSADLPRPGGLGLSFPGVAPPTDSSFPCPTSLRAGRQRWCVLGGAEGNAARLGGAPAPRSLAATSEGARRGQAPAQLSGAAVGASRGPNPVLS